MKINVLVILASKFDPDPDPNINFNPNSNPNVYSHMRM